MRRCWVVLLVMVVVACAGARAAAQSSSLFIEQPGPDAPAAPPPAPAPVFPLGQDVRGAQPAAGGSAAASTGQATLLGTGTGPVRSGSPNAPVDHLSSAIAKASLTALPVPEPKKYALHDLITIVVRESSEAAASGNLNTTKQDNINTQLGNFPDIPILNRIWGAFSNTNLNQNPNTQNSNALVNVQHSNQFTGTGDYDRKDTMTLRLTAEIIDVKPNGTLVLEARRFTQTDKEVLIVSLTGTCRREDVATDNSVISTQLSDLHLTQEHKGEIRGATKKGVLTKAFEFFLNF